MKKILLSVLMLVGLAAASSAQTPELFTYGNHKVNLDEFTRQFYKNNPANSVTRDTAKYYLNLFINFKLKVQQAVDMGMDTAGSFVEEMAQYRKQLAQPYMVDTSANEELIDEAYQHAKMEVKTSHIMVAIGYDVVPKDTLIAWNKIIELKKRLQKESFDSVAAKYSDDQSAKNNFGSLGYFTAFDMIYPFEKAAFNTPVGQIYGPFRTQFGYHVIKVFDKRINRGRANISHIMLKVSPEAKDDEILRVKQKADSILAEINTGRSSFETMVKAYSDDYNTQVRNGEMGWVASTDRGLPVEFRDAVFNLPGNGLVPQPILTPYGWHIIKRNAVEEVKAKDSLYTDFKRKVSNPRDERYSVSKQAVIEKIKKEYNFTENAGALAAFKADSSVLKGEWNSEQHTYSDVAPMFKIGDKAYTQKDFSRFIERNQQPIPNGDISMVVKNLYASFVNESAWEYEENNLPNKHDKYRYLVQEYHDGILLFNLSEKRVWNKGITDTTGLKEYYEANKNRYMWKDRVDAAVYECQKEDVCKKVKKWVKKGYADTTISRMAHDIHPLSLAIKTGKFQHGDHPALEKVKWKKGVKKAVELDGKYYFVVIKSFYAAMPKTLSESRGPITSDYQSMLDKQWIDELKKEYPVTINQANLDAFLSTLPR